MDQYQWPGTPNYTTMPNTSLFTTTEYEMWSMKASLKLILAVILNKLPKALHCFKHQKHITEMVMKLTLEGSWICGSFSLPFQGSFIMHPLFLSNKTQSMTWRGVLTYKSHATVLSPILHRLTPMYWVSVSLISLLLPASISQQHVAHGWHIIDSVLLVDGVSNNNKYMSHRHLLLHFQCYLQLRVEE